MGEGNEGLFILADRRTPGMYEIPIFGDEERVGSAALEGLSFLLRTDFCDWLWTEK